MILLQALPELTKVSDTELNELYDTQLVKVNDSTRRMSQYYDTSYHWQAVSDLDDCISNLDSIIDEILNRLGDK